MRFILLIVIITLVWHFWTPLSNFVAGNSKTASAQITQWLNEHTPK
jgi:hypothetical protein